MRLFPNTKRVKTRLLDEFKGKKILDLGLYSLAEKSVFPWLIPNDEYDLVLCHHLLEYLPDTAKALEELNRITRPGGKIYIEAPHHTRFEAYRRTDSSHRFSLGSFDFFLKGNPYYKTDFQISEKFLYFDDLAFLLGIGFLANLFPRLYEKRLAFIFPANSFHITFSVDK